MHVELRSRLTTTLNMHVSAMSPPLNGTSIPLLACLLQWVSLLDLLAKGLKQNGIDLEYPYLKGVGGSLQVTHTYTHCVQHTLHRCAHACTVHGM